MSEQRIQTVKVDWQTGDAVNKIVTFTRSIKGTDKAVEELNSTLSGTATVTANVAMSKKELSAQARKEFTAATRLVTKYNNLTESLKHQSKMYGMTDDAAEIYAAQMRLGANATKAQKDEIARLVTALQKQRTATSKTTGSMRNLRGQAQNVGWQMQDVAVQMQMGTDAMVIFSQQGSQLASGFGPTGAIVGALIAVGGALAGVAIKALTGKKSLKELAEQQKILNSVFDEGAVSATDLTEKYNKLFAKSKDLAILTAQRAKFAAKDQIRESKRALKEMVKAKWEQISLFKDIANASDQERHANRIMNERAIKDQKKYAKTLGITLEQYQDINSAVEKGNFLAVADKMAKITTATKGALRPLVDLSFGLTEAAQKATDAARQHDAAVKILSGEVTPKAPGASDITKTFESEHARLIKQTESIAEEFNRRARIIFAYGQQVVHDKAKYEEAFIALDKWYTAERKKVSDKRTDEAIKALEKENKRREKVLNQAQKEIGKGKTGDPVLDEMAKHNRLLKTLYAERNGLGMSSYDERQRINALIEQETDRHGEALKNAKIAQMNTDVMLLTTTANMMNATVDLISNGAEQVKAQTAEMNAFQKGMFLTTQMLAASMAVIQGITIGMNLAANQSVMDFTGLSSAAMVTFGTSLGAAQAGAIMGTTFAGMFDAGGTIPNGQAGVVAERYDEMVGGTMVYNNSGSGLNVTGSKDTANAMGGGNMFVEVHNTTSNTVSTSVQQVDENRVKIMIDEHFSKNIDKGVSGVLSKKGSKTDKAMRGNFKAPRKY